MSIVKNRFVQRKTHYSRRKLIHKDRECRLGIFARPTLPTANPFATLLHHLVGSGRLTLGTMAELTK